MTAPDAHVRSADLARTLLIAKSGRQIRLWQCPDPNIVQVMLAELTAWIERRDSEGA